MIHIRKGKIIFIQWNIIGYISHTQGQATCTGVVGWHKNRLKGFGFWFLFVHFLFWYYCIFKVHFNFFHIFEREGGREEVGRREGSRAHEVGWVRRWVGTVMSWGGRTWSIYLKTSDKRRHSFLGWSQMQNSIFLKKIAVQVWWVRIKCTR